MLTPCALTACRHPADRLPEAADGIKPPEVVSGCANFATLEKIGRIKWG